MLVGLVDYQLMFMCIGAVAMVVSVYLWIGRGPSRPDVNAPTAGTTTRPTGTQPVQTLPMSGPTSRHFSSARYVERARHTEQS